MEAQTQQANSEAAFREELREAHRKSEGILGQRRKSEKSSSPENSRRLRREMPDTRQTKLSESIKAQLETITEQRNQVAKF